jgi:chromosome segregation ATPase
MAEENDSGIRARGEEAIGELAQAIAENPVFSGALARALGAGERAQMAQRQALGALNLAASDDVDRLELRIRSFASRLEAIEDALDRLSDDVAALRAGSKPDQEG